MAALNDDTSRWMEAESSEETAFADLACRECRRRKSKCNRVIPVCSLCIKFRRRCIYEKQTKTPLTRRHLTEVEGELARTKALLESLSRGPSNNVAPSSNGVNEDNTTLEQLTSPTNQSQQTPQTPQALPTSATTAHPTAFGGHQRTEEPLYQDQSFHVRSYQSNRTAIARHRPSSSRQTPSSESTKAQALILETPPASGDFDWDERTGRQNGDQFVDGMASLTSNSNGGGYLGVASGAALLRLTDSRPPNEADQPFNNVESHPSTIPTAIWSLSQLEPFIDAYFRLYHVSYPIVHEATFRAQFMEVIPRPTTLAWQVLLYVVAAIGAYSTATQPTDIDLGLFEAAKARLSIDMLETGNLTIVQGLTLISNYLQKRNKPNSGYNYTGLARRIAMGIGLHKEFPNWDATPLMLEMRRRVWWGLYIFDVGAIITFSRPLDFPEGGIETEIPLNVHDSDITAGTRNMPPPAQETTVYSHLRAQSTFHLATCQIYARIISTPYPSATEMLELDDMLIQQWLLSLPQYYQEHVTQTPRNILAHSILRCRYRNFRILMYRPFLVRRMITRDIDRSRTNQPEDHQSSEIAIQRCLDNAQESIDLIANMWFEGQKPMMACWYGLYFLFQAVLIPVICLRNQPQSPAANSWLAQVTTAIHVIESMAQLNPSAQRCLGVIRSLCGAYLVPNTDVDGWDATQESPQTQLNGLYPLLWPTLDTAQFEGVDNMLQESTIMEFMNQIPDFG
ncbi:hypothetical protein BU16DRAFT_621315 [Lophium mytilinum]|uniref:Zn(2)-C6 fungal-type domain-containing protein n=1 Tax=Lophium mytilinum TaxID=390894 RepID=A0A6A6QHW7_9PEZI|nr:hypothetical protein BU16DRAFT_621315 [Lophium mytilinum]